MNPTPNNRHRPRVLFVFVQHFFPVAGVVLPLFGRRTETSDGEKESKSLNRTVGSSLSGRQVGSISVAH